MKKYILKSLGLTMVLSALVACQTTPMPQKNAALGLLICEPNELCPIVQVSWNEQALDHVGIKVSLDSVQQNYDIQKITFSNGTEELSYGPTAKTTNRMYFGMHRSQNNFSIPTSLVHTLKGDNISMSVHTNQGTLERYIYKSGQESLIYQQLKSIRAQK
ncbi:MULTISPECIES: hypothetical protein [Acinetobacter]|uniref:hypothetical protein n=1 Tax=Acinetobacter TaxID=469 RepID=UPI000EC42297|nr:MULTISPECIES: hypothetical protein [Acinetobacter]RKG41272.1 hypothetical protein D7V51_14275 [Acinetobacter cumulans]RZG57133.1 hypothetical protein EXE29_14135 [Acinetobacter sp. WCHAc060006]